MCSFICVHGVYASFDFLQRLSSSVVARDRIYLLDTVISRGELLLWVGDLVCPALQHAFRCLDKVDIYDPLPYMIDEISSTLNREENDIFSRILQIVLFLVDSSPWRYPVRLLVGSWDGNSMSSHLFMSSLVEDRRAVHLPTYADSLIALYEGVQREVWLS